ncbi:Cleavage stimulation factor subunit [Dirofilaria immitis]
MGMASGNEKGDELGHESTCTTKSCKKHTNGRQLIAWFACSADVVLFLFGSFLSLAKVSRSVPEKIMSRSVFVGNLPYSAREEDVANFFWQVGPVTSVRIVLDRDTGRPRGFGFCEFETEAAAEQAVGSMNHAEFMGRQLRVDRAISR